MGQYHRSATVEAQHRLLNARIHVEKRPRRSDTGAIHQKPDLDVADGGLQDLNDVARGEIGGRHARFDAIHVFDGRRELFEPITAARNEHHVDPALGDTQRVLGADSRGCARDDSPGPVLLGELAHRAASLSRTARRHRRYPTTLNPRGS